MSLRNQNLFIGVFIFIAFMGIGVFGLLPFTHSPHGVDMPMVDCPYADGGYSLCESTLEHVKNWQQFSNVIFPSLFILFLIFGIVWYYFNSNLITEAKYFYRRKYYLNDEKLYSYQEKITKWLSLFENSPSFALKT